MRYLLQVAVWQSDTSIAPNQLNTNMTGGLPVDARLALLKALVDEAYEDCQSEHSRANPGADPLYLLLAPEYFFSRSDTQHILPEATKDHIVTTIQDISADHPNMILIPGTIAWKKLLRGGDPNKKVSRAKRALERLKNAPTLNEGVRKSSIRAIQGKRMDENLDPDSLYMAQNTAYVFYKGRVFHKYHKKVDAGEVKQDESNYGQIIFVPGMNRTGFFKIKGVKFGIEICGEHESGILLSDVPEQVDVHMIVAASVKNVRDSFAAVDGGFVIHVDSLDRETSVVQVNRGGNDTVVNPTFENEMRAKGLFQDLFTDDEYYRAKVTDIRESSREYYQPLKNTPDLFQQQVTKQIKKQKSGLVANIYRWQLPID